MLLGPTDLVESIEDMMRATSFLSVGHKKRILSPIIQKVWTVFMRMFNIYFSLRSNARKIIVENINTNKYFLILFQLISK